MQRTTTPVNKPLRLQIGDRIRQKRVLLGFSQRTLTTKAKLSSQRHLWGIEQGQAGLSIESAFKLANALGWTLSELFAGIT